MIRPPTPRGDAIRIALIALLYCISVRSPSIAHGAEKLAWLRADGTRMVDSSGKLVILRGCNLGNWLAIETWMLGGTITGKDQGELTDILTQRFGPEAGYALM